MKRKEILSKQGLKSTPDPGLFCCPNKDLVFHAHQGHLYNSHHTAEWAIRLLHWHLNYVIFSGLVRYTSTCLIPPTSVLVTAKIDSCVMKSFHAFTMWGLRQGLEKSRRSQRRQFPPHVSMPPWEDLVASRALRLWLCYTEAQSARKKLLELCRFPLQLIFHQIPSQCYCYLKDPTCPNMALGEGGLHTISGVPNLVQRAKNPRANKGKHRACCSLYMR